MDFLQSIEPWAAWLTAAAVLLIIELFSGSMVALCLAIGCIAAMIVAGIGCGLLPQLLILIVVTMVVLIFLGPAIKRLYRKTRHGHSNETNMAAIIGRVGKVTHRVTNHSDDHGRVQIDGDSWLAYTDSPEQPLERGTQVRVDAYDSIVLKVSPLRRREISEE